MLVIEESPTNPWKSNGGADLNELRKKASKGLYLTSLKPEEQLEDIAGKLTLIRGEKEKDINLPTRFPNLNRDTTKQALKATLGPAVINLDA
jgi:hypothetical protein